MEVVMNSPEKQLKYSIRKVSVGAASVVIGALYLLMGAGIAHAEGVESAREAERTANPTDPEQSGNGELENKADLSNTDAAASTYNAPVAENPLVASESMKPRTRSKRELADGDASNPSNGATETESGDNQPTGENSPVLDANRKGDVVKDDQPGVRVPKAGEKGADDKNANLTFDDPGEDATVEEMWKIIQNMPDDFQNNERSYLRNMDTLGDALRFKNGKVSEDADGVKLQDGEIREIDSFGGWHAINKKGHVGKFAIGKKNAQGYFTGWYIDKDGERQEGGMLGSNALDQIFLHEQALDRRFKYMLMLAKGRTLANKNDEAQDGTPFDIKTANRTGNKEKLASLPVKDKEDILQHSPNLVGFNGIEKNFTAFSTKYGSRLKIDFVTGYISDYEKSKGTYRIVVKAIKKGATADAPNVEETIYDHTINRIDGVVENEERYSQGVDLNEFNKVIKNLLKDEYIKKVNALANAKYNEKYPGERRDNKKLAPLKEEAKQELVKNGDVIYELPIDKDKLQLQGKNSFKEGIPFTDGYTTVANKLNNSFSKTLDPEVQPNSPTWANATDKKSDGTLKRTDTDRVYEILNFVLPTAKKIIYHADTDQLELQTDPEKVKSHRAELETKLKAKEEQLKTVTDETEITKLKKEISALKSAIRSTNAYTYLEARNGSKEAKILGSHMEATEQPSTSTLTEDEYNKIKTNKLAAEAQNGLSKFTNYFVEKEKVKRDNVISDEKLSEEITKAIDGDQDKLGKGGYFSTGDIPLGKDVVAYKIQVFAENEKRVGVNKQSPRLQYNLPILADFSVIQDTVEPSKEVTTRIITKLKEQGKITEDQEKKIKEEIKKSKKTSELRSQLSGDVKVKYQDVNGTLLTLKNTVTGQKETDLGKKGEDGTYLAVDSGLRYTEYNVSDKKLETITASDGKRYRLKRSLDDGTLEEGRLKASAAETGTISANPATVTFVYEEYTPPVTGKGLVHFKKQVSDTTAALTGYGDITLSGNVGETFSSTEVDAKITELKNAGYEIVSNELDTKSKTIDSTADVDGQEPSQVYNVIVRERVKTVTTPPTPNDPVDPNNGEGPKWPETGLAKSDLEKEVTRTITYVKKETPNGQEEPSGVENKVDKVLFKRTATYNLVTKKITYGEWTATTDESHPASKLPAVDTPLKTGYIADIKQVEGQDAPKPTETGEVTNIEKKVVYTKLGSWVPKIPGKDSTPIPYPNDPKDPTKPKYPDYPKTPENPGETPNPQPENPDGGTPEKPKTPELPVIPYEPGYTPKIGEKPLEPVDPKDPKKGYKVPEIPKRPGEDTPITYEADPQKAIVKYVVEGTTTVLHTEELTGDSGTTINYTTANKLAELKVLGYELVIDGFTTETGRNFDNDKTVDQTFEVTVKPKVVDVPPFEPTNPKGDDNPKPEPGKPIDPENPNGPKWTKELIDKLATTKHVTRTITYVEDGTDKEVANKATDKVTFTRSLKVNVVTGDVVDPNVAWTSNDTTFDEVASPVVKGYVLKANQGSEDGLVSTDGTRVAASTNLTAASENQNVKVLYTKLGSWVPTPPAGVTPPTGTNFDPKPYPNHPTDPTTPGTPVYPEPGQPITPGTPVIPYVPGYTPKTPDGNPLVPVDPNHPENGYKVPPVPTTPGEDTPITYEANPQKALVKVVKVEGTTETPLTEDNVAIAGKTGEAIPTESVTAKIADLEKRGYIVDNKQDVLTAIAKDPFDKAKDTDGEDPTQTFTLKVHEKVVEVTEPPTPDTPIDPENPNGPKWTEELVNQLSLKKDVTRTITYVKKDTPNGEELPNAKPTVTQTAHFKRNVKVNVATGTVVEYTGWTSTDNNLAAVPTDKLDGYVADKASVEGVETSVDSTDLDKKVVYTKLGSWIPNKPGEKTPTPLPYPNHPTDPTKPGDPTDPNTPVIPYVPGYTPKIGETPLQPKVPNDPTQGYIPPVPTTPGEDTPIEYVKDGQQKAITSFVDPKGNVLETPITETGDSNTPLTKGAEVAKKIAELKAKGYDVVGNTYPPKGMFDNDPKVDQYYKVTLVPHVEPVKPFDPTDPKDPNKPVPGQPIDPKNPEGPKWNEELIKQVTTKKEVTRTINYVDEKGNKLSEPSTDKVTFTREAKINVVTGEITYGDWKAVGGDSTFDKVSSPVVKGYILKDPAQKEVAERKGITPTVANQTLEVVYKKLGSWIPKVPGVETPTPLPYPNDPTDPTKPGDPTDPNVPVIPYVPGYTPKTPDGNPLVPKVPNDPTKGYIPPVPTEPGKDTPIEYVKVPNTPSPEEPVKPTPESNHITIWVDENGKPLKPEKPGTHEPGNISGYRYITTVTKDGVTIHKFEKITPVEPNNPVPQKPTTPIPTPQDPTIPTPESQIPIPNTPEENTPTSETNRREELPNTGTEANATLATAGIMVLLAGLGLGFLKKKEEDEK